MYTYLVNAHWSLEQKKTYTFVNLADPELNIQCGRFRWRSPSVPEADLHHPMLKDAMPMAPKRTPGDGLQRLLGHARFRPTRKRMVWRASEYTDIDEFDSPDPKAYEVLPIEPVRHDHQRWRLHGPSTRPRPPKAVRSRGRRMPRVRLCWPRWLRDHHITLVHVSSDYVFDGTAKEHTETEAFAPHRCTADSRPLATSPWPTHLSITSCVPAG